MNKIFEFMKYFSREKSISTSQEVIPYSLKQRIYHENFILLKKNYIKDRNSLDDIESPKDTCNAGSAFSVLICWTPSTNFIFPF